MDEPVKFNWINTGFNDPNLLIKYKLWKVLPPIISILIPIYPNLDVPVPDIGKSELTY